MCKWVSCTSHSFQSHLLYSEIRTKANSRQELLQYMAYVTAAICQHHSNPIQKNPLNVWQKKEHLTVANRSSLMRYPLGNYCWCKPFQLVCVWLFSGTFNVEMKIYKSLVLCEKYEKPDDSTSLTNFNTLTIMIEFQFLLWLAAKMGKPSICKRWMLRAIKLRLTEIENNQSSRSFRSVSMQLKLSEEQLMVLGSSRNLWKRVIFLADLSRNCFSKRKWLQPPLHLGHELHLSSQTTKSLIYL